MAVLGITRLLAQNEMLAAIMEERHPSLGGAGTWPSYTYTSTIAGAALFVLDRVTRSVLLRGWDENTVHAKKYTVSAGPSAITFGTTVLAIKPAGPTQHRRIGLKGDSGYDLENDAATFANGDYFFDIVVDRDFDDCSPRLKELIVKEAKQEFQRERKGNPAQDAYIGDARNKAELLPARTDSEPGLNIRNEQPIISQSPSIGGRQ